MTPRTQPTLTQHSNTESSQPIVATSLEEDIRHRAYELYEARGKQEGFAEQDWLQAESELTGDQASKAAA